MRREQARDLSEIRLAGSRVAITCLVHDISSAGAQIEAATGTLPRRFVLTNFTRRDRAVCEVVWQRGSRFGLRFAVPPRHID